MPFRLDEFRKIYREMNTDLELVPIKKNETSEQVCVRGMEFIIELFGIMFVLASIVEDIRFL